MTDSLTTVLESCYAIRLELVIGDFGVCYNIFYYYHSNTGDAIHSFIEGIAIGGGYAKSFYGGVGTTIAIVCHEVPHCVGKTSYIYFKIITRRQLLRYFNSIVHSNLINGNFPSF